MMSQPQQQFSYLTAALNGGTVIEASAGTGKTWTLERLVVRLLIEKEMSRNAGAAPESRESGIARILIVTFTKAATNDLIDRLGETGLQLLELIGDDGEPSAAALKDKDWGELLQHWGSLDLSFAAIRAELKNSLDRFDDAAIYTIHSFCQKMLQSYAFSGGEPLDETLGDEAGLIAEVVEEFVRREVSEKPQLATQIMESKDTFSGLLKALSSRPAAEHKKVQFLGPPPPKTNKRKKNTEEEPVEETPQPDPCQPLREVFEEFCVKGPRALQERKRRLGLLTYNDMLVRMYELIQAHDDKSQAFIARVQEKFDAVLIDEFQDTDGLQFGIFSRLFLEDKNSDRAVFVVGDPKQSIYAFRGAQLAAYYHACEEIGASRKATLARNFRSTPELVAAVNLLFCREQSFANPQIRCPEVAAGRESAPLLFEGPDGTKQPLPVLTILNSRVTGDADAAKNYENRWIAAQISSLLRCSVYVKGRRLRASDIVILVRTRSEAPDLIGELRQVGIRAVVDGGADVLKSAESREMLAILAAMADPRHAGSVVAARATRIWGEQLVDLQSDERIAATRILLQELCAVLEREGVAAAFARLFAERKVAARLLPQLGGERALANYAQLVELLSLHTSGSQSAATLARTLSSLMGLSSATDDPAAVSDERELRPESDEDLVRIQTIHQSKGLEYPVVFLHNAGRLSRPTKHKDVRVFQKDSKDGLPQLQVFLYKPSFSEKTPETQFVREQEEAESIRLFYVAATRASARLYLPIVLNLTEKDRQKGQDSNAWWCKYTALAMILNRGESADSHKNVASLYRHFAEEVQGAADETVFKVIDDPDGTALDGPVLQQAAAATKPPLLKADPAAEHPRSWSQTSFTGLTRGQSSVGLLAADDESEDEDAETESAPRPVSLFAAGGIANLTVVPATALGVLLHKVFEDSTKETNRELFLDPATRRSWVANILADFSSLEFVGAADPAQAIADNLADVWSCELLPGLVLKDIPVGAMAAELRFLLPLAPGVRAADISQVIRRHAPDLDPGALTGHDLAGFLEGSLDLALAANGKYWVLDWKSNRAAAWDRATLTAKVHESRYQLQLLIYLVALKRFVAARTKAADPWSLIGGAADIFLRGIDGSESLIDGARSGVVPLLPNRALLEDLDALFAGAKA